MFEIIYRFDPERPVQHRPPADAVEARTALDEGNRQFVHLLEPATSGDHRHVIPIGPRELGGSPVEGEAPAQAPFAIVLGCADARVPAELVFQQAANDLFVVRVAGHVLESACLGSIEYAAAHLGGSVQLAVVLGHTHCGAVTAAAQSFVEPGTYPEVAKTQGLRSIVDRLLVPVRGAALALREAWGEDVEAMPGYRAALVETAVVMNSAMTALTLQQELGTACQVAYGVFDLVSRAVGVPLEGEVHAGLRSPPSDAQEFGSLGSRVARSQYVEACLR
jgi:carbonic anhydrase